ncbi:GntR family transcriptional regulator [Clostridium neuense]|uniref:GntR family transcriptional regulator n=1 Tax=Clostridium neuense TaxID=1728934 RepID=A0ABW8TAM2_9CLOT
MIDYRMPLYIQIQDIIVKKIEEHEYLPGELIPSERKMAEKYGVNRMTVKKAINELVKKGYVYRIKGSGTYINKSERQKFNLGFVNEIVNTGITTMLKNVGVAVSNRVLGLGKIDSSNFINAKLGMKAGEEVFGLHRVRYAGKRPIAVEYTYVPKCFFEDMESIDFKNVALYDYMSIRNHLPQHFIQNLTIIDATEKEAELLELEKGKAIFKMEYIGADNDYNIVEFTESYMDPDNVDFRYDTISK